MMIDISSFDMGDFITTITYIISGSSLILLGLKGLSKITKTTKDDEIIGKIMSKLEKLEGLLRFLSLSPKNANRIDILNKK